MIHNGIGKSSQSPEDKQELTEQNTPICPSVHLVRDPRGLLHHQLGMTNDEIADLFEQWYNDKVFSQARRETIAKRVAGHA